MGHLIPQQIRNPNLLLVTANEGIVKECLKGGGFVCHVLDGEEFFFDFGEEGGFGCGGVGCVGVTGVEAVDLDEGAVLLGGGGGVGGEGAG